jgi:periplasmic protein TonB
LHLHLGLMQSWHRITAIAIGIAALHGAALWAMARYTAQPQTAREPPTVVARLLQPPAQLPQAEAAVPAPSPTPKPVSSPKAAVVATDKSLPAPTKPAPEQATALQAPTAKPTAQSPSGPAAESAAAAPAKPSATVAPVSTDAVAGAATAANTLPKTIGIAAEPVYSVTPVYTMLMKGLEETGRVQISFEVDVNGQAVNARVAQSSGFSRLDDAALDAARKSRYKSAICGDKKVQSKYTRNYAFLVPPLPDPPQPAIDCTAP